MGFIRKLLLPREVDFNAALREQAHLSRRIVSQLYHACMQDDAEAFQAIDTSAQQAKELKNHNMTELLNVFITPYDKESIYRMITQLDWIALSVKHFRLETVVYNMHSLDRYEPILAILKSMATTLETGIAQLENKPLNVMGTEIDRIRDQYDEVVSLCARATGVLLARDDCKKIIQEKDILLQLKEIAKRIHIAANTLEDMAIKVV